MNKTLIRLVILLALQPRPLLAQGVTQGATDEFKGELASCNRRDSNLKNTQKLANDHVSQGCKDVVKTAFEACFSAPQKLSLAELAQGDTSASQVGLGSTVQAFSDLYKQGETRMNIFATTCKDQLDSVNARCKEISDGLLQAIKNNTRDGNDLANQTLKAGPNDPNRLTNLNRIQNYQNINAQLSNDRSANSAFFTSAQKALQDQVVCYANRARLYAIGSTQTMAALTSTQTDPVPTAQQDTPSDPLVDNATDASKQSLYSKSAEKVANAIDQAPAGVLNTTEATTTTEVAEQVAGKTAGTVAKLGGGIFPAISAANGDVLGTTTGTAGVVADLFATPTTALRVTGVGLFANIMLTPNELGHCDVNYTDPVQAYNSGCKLTTQAGANYGEKAIFNLSQP